MAHTKMIDDLTDLTYDKEEGVWYFQRYVGGDGNCITSASYESEEDAMDSLKEGKVTWIG